MPDSDCLDGPRSAGHVVRADRVPAVTNRPTIPQLAVAQYIRVNGAFTEQLLKVWNGGTFTGNYAQFHAKIKAHMPPTQSPNLFQLGPTAAFTQQRPFSV